MSIIQKDARHLLLKGESTKLSLRIIELYKYLFKLATFWPANAQGCLQTGVLYCNMPRPITQKISYCWQNTKCSKSICVVNKIIRIVKIQIFSNLPLPFPTIHSTTNSNWWVVHSLTAPDSRSSWKTFQNILLIN